MKKLLERKFAKIVNKIGVEKRKEIFSNWTTTLSRFVLIKSFLSSAQMCFNNCL